MRNIVFACLVHVSIPSHAATDSVVIASDGAPLQRSVFSAIGHDAFTFLSATGYVLSAPVRWNGGDWALAAGVLGVSGALSLLDDEVVDAMDRLRRDRYDRTMKDFRRYSELPAAVLVSGMYLVGLAVQDEWIRETAVLAGSTIIISWGVSKGGKFTVGRARPYVGNSNHQYRMFTSDNDYNSFPSGHTAVAFSMSAVFSERIKNTYATIALYGLAVASSVPQAYFRDHWFSDLVFTSLYTTIIARSVVQWHERRSDAEGSSSRLHLLPTGSGISLVWKL